MRFPLPKAVAEVMLEARGCLVAFLGGLGEELQHNVGDRRRYRRRPLDWRRRLASNVTVDPFHRIGRGERQAAGQHPIERDAEGVEIAAGIHRPVHPPGLFWCHIGERAGDGLGRLRHLALT
jgi:hypothetical protein